MYCEVFVRIVKIACSYDVRVMLSLRHTLAISEVCALGPYLCIQIALCTDVDIIPKSLLNACRMTTQTMI